MAGAPLLLCMLHVLQKTQRSWRCRGSCGLVGLVWEHAKTCAYASLPPRRSVDTTQTQDTIYTLAWVHVNLLATCDLS